MSAPVAETGLPGGDRLGRARQAVIGCFAGQAIGGAVGAGVQFESLESFAAAHGDAFTGEYPPAFGGAGRITADTQLSLFVLDGLIRAHFRRRRTGAADPLPEVEAALRRWLRTQQPDVGGADGWFPARPALAAKRWPDRTTLDVLTTGRFGSIERPVTDSAESGVLPRAAAAALWSAAEEQVFELGARIAALTHGHPSAYLSAGAYAVIVNRILRGIGNPVRAVDSAVRVLRRWPGHEPVSTALETAVDWFHQGEEAEVSAASVQELGEGLLAPEALAMAVRATLSDHRFEQVIARAVGHSGNSSTVGALTGGLYGVLFDFTATIPVPLLRDLELGEEIATLADAAVKEFGPRPPSTTGWLENFPFGD
ncbi:ADP-ribosylglycohydrolase family protein [Crossiella sp. NPDC003009]